MCRPVKMSDISAVVHRSTRQHGVSDAFSMEAGIGHVRQWHRYDKIDIRERYIHIPAVVYVICNDETFALFGLHGSIAGNGDDVHAKGSI